MEHQYLFTATSYPSYYLEGVAFQHNQDGLLDPALISDNNNNNPTIYSPSPPPAGQHGQWEAPSQVQRFLSETQKTPFFGGTDFPAPRMNPSRAVPQRPAAGIRPVPSPSQSHSQGLRFGSPISSIEPSSASGSALSPPADNECYPHTPPETARFSPYQQPHQLVAPYDKWSTAAQAHQFAGIGCVNLNDINPNNNNSQAASHVDYCESEHNYDFDFSASQLLYGGGGSSDGMDPAILIDFNNNKKERRMASPEEDEMEMHAHSAAIEISAAAASPYPPLLSTTEDDIDGSDDDDDSSSPLRLLPPPLSKRKKAAADDDDGEYKPTGSKRSKSSSSSSSSPTRRGPGRPPSSKHHQHQVDLPVRRRSSPDGSSPSHTSPARKRNKTTTTTAGGTGGGGTTSTFPARPSAAAPKMLTTNPSKGSFPCEACGQPFKDRTLLDNHFKKIHQRPFKCVFHFAGCGSIFASKNEWKRHVTSQHLVLHYWLCQEGGCAKTVNSDAHLPRGKIHRTGLGASTLLVPPSSGGASGSGSSLPNGSIFNRKDLYTQHLRRMHTPPGIKKSYKAAKKAGTTTASASGGGGGGGEISKWEEHIKKLQQRAEIKRCKLPEFMTCPVASCRQEFTGTEAWDQRMEHVARHLDRSAAANNNNVRSSSEKEDVVVVFGGKDDSTLVDWASHPDVDVIRRRSGDGGGGGEWELNDPLKKRGGTHTGNSSGSSSSSSTHVHGGQQHHQGEMVIVAHTPRYRGQDSVRSEIVVGDDEEEEEQEQEEEDMVDVDADADADADGEEDDT